jgi:hypothetical protein
MVCGFCTVFCGHFIGVMAAIATETILGVIPGCLIGLIT